MKKIIIKGKYLHKSCIPILYLLLLFLGGCIHQYPDETPTENVSLEMELLLDGEFIPLPAITKTDEGVVNESYASRVIVEARRAGESVSIWGIERSVFFNGWEKWAKGFENQRV